MRNGKLRKDSVPLVPAGPEVLKDWVTVATDQDVDLFDGIDADQIGTLVVEISSFTTQLPGRVPNNVNFDLSNISGRAAYGAFRYGTYGHAMNSNGSNAVLFLNGRHVQGEAEIVVNMVEVLSAGNVFIGAVSRSTSISSDVDVSNTRVVIAESVVRGYVPVGNRVGLLLKLGGYLHEFKYRVIRKS